MSHISADAPVSIIGHSYGGAVAVKTAERLDCAIDALVLYEANAIQLLPDETPPAGGDKGLLEQDDCSPGCR